MKWMDQLPSVTTCCFCCFLRAGCVMISVISFVSLVVVAADCGPSKMSKQRIVQLPDEKCMEKCSEIKKHPRSFNREDGFNLSPTWEPEIQKLKPKDLSSDVCVDITAGLILAPNVAYTQMPSLLPEPLTNTEGTAQVLLGLVSILLCACSFLLFVGSFCNVPILIEIYLWGELVYGTSTTIIYIILACFCFLVHSNSVTAGAWLILLIFVNFFLTCYFLIIANSLRMSLLFLHSTEVIY